MADFPSLGLQQRTSQSQKQVQTQTQKLSQQQLLSLKLLSMGTQDLRREIYDTVAKTPALIITRDKFLDGIKNAKASSTMPSDNLNVKSVSAAGKEASDNFQAALESAPDDRETLAEHLEFQFNSMKNPKAVETLGLKLIHNLDSHGFHILSPYSFLPSGNPQDNTALLEKTLDILHQLDPVGTCVRNFEESLFVQAKYRGDAPAEALFILNGHFEFLSPPRPEKIAEKIRKFPTYTAEEIVQRDSLDFSSENLLSVIEYIKTLDPYPARNYSQPENIYIQPEVYVEKDQKSGQLAVRVDDQSLPVVEIANDFMELSRDRTRVTKSTEESEKKRSEHRFVMDQVRAASDFLDSIAFRQKMVLLACQQIVSFQKDFFEKGQQYLKPLTQKEIAKAINASESTVSRIAKEKFLKCDAGIFPISFFFSTAVGAASEADSSSSSSGTPSPSEVPGSQSAILFVLQQILEEHRNDKKSLSDQKLSDLLAERGIKIARRTVAKYRSKLNIDSSYNR